MAAPSSPTSTLGVKGQPISNLKLTQISLDMDAWENVPGPVYKSFHIVAQNILGIQKWANKKDENARQSAELHQQCDSRIQSLDASLRATHERLERLSTDIQRNAHDDAQISNVVAFCLGTLLRSTHTLLANFGKSFGFDLGWSAEEAAANAALAGNGDDLPVLRNLCKSLDTHLQAAEESFECWSTWRSAQMQRADVMQGNLDALAAFSEQLQERLLKWHEMLKENTRVSDALGNSLASTQGAVRELQRTQVQKHDVEEVVRTSAEELESLIQQTESHMDEFAERVEERMDEVHVMLQDMRKETDSQIEVHSGRVAEMVERNLNPVNAYLNTMHVKSDTVRAELNSLNEWVPRLSKSIDGVASDLQQRDDASRQRVAAVSDRLDELTVSTTNFDEKASTKNLQLSGDLAELSRSFGAEIAGIRNDLGETAQAVEATKSTDLRLLTKELSSLEQKVAKWIHANPLPAKMSEARLFSLEARLNEETDARLHLEKNMKPARSRTRQSLALPQMNQQQLSADATSASLAMPRSARRATDPGGTS